MSAVKKMQGGYLAVQGRLHNEDDSKMRRTKKGSLSKRASVPRREDSMSKGPEAQNGKSMQMELRE